MSNETLYTDWDTAFIPRVDGKLIGRVWYEEDTQWNAYHNDSDVEWDFIDSYSEAVDLLYREEGIAL